MGAVLPLASVCAHELSAAPGPPPLGFERPLQEDPVSSSSAKAHTACTNPSRFSNGTIWPDFGTEPIRAAGFAAAISASVASVTAGLSAPRKKRTGAGTCGQ